MPFGPVTRPSLAPGLLKSELGAIGVSAHVENLALSFAGLIGDEAYMYLTDHVPPELLAGEWVFSSCLFGDDPARTDAYERLARSSTYRADVELIRHAQSRAGDFLRHCLASVDWHAYDVVGFTTTFAQNVASLALAVRVKQLHPSSVVVFGGANCEGEMALGLHRSFPFVDLVCAGEADLTLPRLLRVLREEGEPGKIPGIVARQQGRSACASLSPEQVKDLDELPYPNFDEFFEQGGGASRRVVVMETARGCWWGDKHHCTFCGIDFPLKYRSKTPGRALDELLSLRDEYDARLFVMTDEILDMRYFRDFIPRLAELSRPVSVFYETKANLTKDQVRLLARAGIRQIQPGIESFSAGVLSLIDKGVAPAQNVQLLKWCEECGIEPRWNILYGIPGEEADDYAAATGTIAALEHLRPPQGCGPIRLDRFSPYFTDPSTFSISNIRPSAAYRHVYDLPEESLARLAYYFDFDFADDRDPAAYTSALREKVRHWKAAYRPGSLVYTDDGETVTIADRRGGLAREYEYSGWRRDVYVCCDAGRPRSRVEELAEQSGARFGEVGRFLAELVEARLLVELDGRCVSLAVQSPQDVDETHLVSSGTKERTGSI
jgi:ribosomal peptide maturation radical SAM protein 1